MGSGRQRTQRNQLLWKNNCQFTVADGVPVKSNVPTKTINRVAATAFKMRFLINSRRNTFMYAASLAQKRNDVQLEHLPAPFNYVNAY